MSDMEAEFILKSSVTSSETLVERRFAERRNQKCFFHSQQKKKKKKVKSSLMVSGASSKATESTKECLSGSLSGPLPGNALNMDVSLNDASMSLHTVSKKKQNKKKRGLKQNNNNNKNFVSQQKFVPSERSFRPFFLRRTFYNQKTRNKSPRLIARCRLFLQRWTGKDLQKLPLRTEKKD